METIITKPFLNSNMCKILTIEEIKNNLATFKITNISLDDRDILASGNRQIISLKNDYDHPLTLEENSFLGDFLNINPEYFQDNPLVIEELMQYIAKNTPEKQLNISSANLITDKVIDSLCQNTNLEEVGLTKYSDEPYALTVEDYQKLKTSTLKEVKTKSFTPELEANLDKIFSENTRGPLIGADKKLIGSNTYKDLTTSSMLSLNKPLTPEELPYLKYLNPTAKINFKADDLTNLQAICNQLQELNKEPTITINLNNYDKEKFNQQILNLNINYSNILIKIGLDSYSLKDYLNYEKSLYQLVEPAYNLSPFERYIYAYNITKNYKKYKENEESREQARNLYDILNNEYMVCVGFSNLLRDLATKLGIETENMSGVTIDTSYDDYYRGKEALQTEKVTTDVAKHARNYVHLVDPKYGLDGIYISDATWDNDLEHDYYNYLALTNEEASNAIRYLWLDEKEELFNIHNLEEFYQKLNFLLSRVKNNETNKTTDKLLGEAVQYLVSTIKALDSSYYQQLVTKYPFIKDERYNKDLNDLLYDLGQYITNHVNKEISGETIMLAVSNVYKNAYGLNEEECHKKLLTTIEENKLMQVKAFPKRIAERADGTSEVIMNAKNKFEINKEGRTL